MLQFKKMLLKSLEVLKPIFPGLSVSNSIQWLKQDQRWKAQLFNATMPFIAPGINTKWWQLTAIDSWNEEKKILTFYVQNCFEKT